jgi:hypothetical protein
VEDILGAVPSFTPISGNGLMRCPDEAINDTCKTAIGSLLQIMLNYEQCIGTWNVVNSPMGGAVPMYSSPVSNHSSCVRHSSDPSHYVLRVFY